MYTFEIMGLIHRPTFNLVCTIIGAGFILTIHSLYYIKVFFEEFHLPPSYLKVVQILFLVWNAINDPIMGYMQDLGCCGMKWIMDRRKVIQYAGPVFAASFLLFWFPWSTTVGWITALQMLVALFIYDTLLTLVLSAYCGLCVEMSRNHADRVRVIVYGEIFTIIAGFMIYPLETMPHTKEHFWMFQMICVAVACASAALMVFSGTKLKKSINTLPEIHQLEKFEEEPDPKKEIEKEGWRQALKVSWQVVKEPRFICLVGAQFFKILRFMANENFLIPYTDALLMAGGFFVKESSSAGLFLILARSCGSLLFLLLWFPTNRFGTQAIIQALNIASLINVAVMLYCGMDNVLHIAIFIVLENAISRCGWQGFYIVVAGEVVDTDMKQHNRKSPFSTIIFTLKALFNKPADQLAPILVLTFFLENGGYPGLTNTCTSISDGVDLTNSTMLVETSSMSMVEGCSNYKNWMFLALTIFPAICVFGESLFVGIDQYLRRNVKTKTHHLGDD